MRYTGNIMIDLDYIFPMKPSEYKNSISIESYDEKAAENYRNCYFAKKPLSFLIAQIEDLYKDWVKISHSYLLYFPRNKPSKSVTVGTDWFIVEKKYPNFSKNFRAV